MLWVFIRIASAILMTTHNIGFYEDLTKIIFELSSNTHLISSAGHFIRQNLLITSLAEKCSHFKNDLLLLLCMG